MTTYSSPIPTVTRCRICGHKLHAERSRRLCVGPVCAHRIAAAITLQGWRVDTVVAANNGNALTVVLVPLAVAP